MISIAACRLRISSALPRAFGPSIAARCSVFLSAAAGGVASGFGSRLEFINFLHQPLLFGLLLLFLLLGFGFGFLPGLFLCLAVGGFLPGFFPCLSGGGLCTRLRGCAARARESAHTAARTKVVDPAGCPADRVRYPGILIRTKMCGGGGACASHT